jgi:hypothetical protein
LLVQRPTPNLEDQVSVFMTPGDRVAQLYPQALGTHSRLLRHAWVTVGLFFNPGHHTGQNISFPCKNYVRSCCRVKFKTILIVVASYLGSQTGVERREGPIERGEVLDPDYSSRKHWLVSDRSITCSAYDTLAFSDIAQQ